MSSELLQIVLQMERGGTDTSGSLGKGCLLTGLGVTASLQSNLDRKEEINDTMLFDVQPN